MILNILMENLKADLHIHTHYSTADAETKPEELVRIARKLGLDVIYIQAKRWDNPVSRPEIQKFAGALEMKRANKGIFITTGNFRESTGDRGFK